MHRVWKFTTDGTKPVLKTANFVSRNRGWSSFESLDGTVTWKEHGFKWSTTRKAAALAYGAMQVQRLSWPELCDGYEVRRAVEAAYLAGQRDGKLSEKQGGLA